MNPQNVPSWREISIILTQPEAQQEHMTKMQEPEPRQKASGDFYKSSSLT